MTISSKPENHDAMGRLADSMFTLLASASTVGYEDGDIMSALCQLLGSFLAAWQDPADRKVLLDTAVPIALQYAEQCRAQVDGEPSPEGAVMADRVENHPAMRTLAAEMHTHIGVAIRAGYGNIDVASALAMLLGAYLAAIGPEHVTSPILKVIGDGAAENAREIRAGLALMDMQPAGHA